MLNEFKAGTKYNDFYGTVAADISDNLFLSALLPKNEQLLENEAVIGFYVGFSGNAGNSTVSPGVVLHIGYEEDGHLICTRSVEISLNGKNLSDLFQHLKIFNFVVSRKGKEVKRQGE